MDSDQEEFVFEEVIHEQSMVGDKLEKLYINYGKDSASRKDEQYITKRLEISKAYWALFQYNHKRLAPLEEEYKENLYFKKSYHDAIKEVYQQLMKELRAHPARPKSPAPPGSFTTAANIPVPIATSSDVEPTLRDDDESNEIEQTPGDEGMKTGNGEVERLVRRQKALMRIITHLVQDIESKAGQPHEKPYYQLKVELLRTYQRDMMANDQLIWEQSAGPNPLGYEPDLYYEQDGWIQDTIISLQQKLSDFNTATNQAASSQAHSGLIKLPKIVLPTFDGNYLRWTQFQDLYIQLIHNQPISNAQKMFYLTSNLSGEARALIQHLPVSNENYEDAWSTLQHRYDNKRLLVTALLNKLLSQPTSQIESAAAIKKLHDTTNECLLGLKNIGIPTDNWDPLLVHLITKRFDQTTHTLFEQSLEAPRELSSMKRVLEFLEIRFQSLETLTGRVQSCFRDRLSLKGIQHPKSALLATSNGNRCIACKQTHALFACKSFLSLSPYNRLQLLRKHHLCVNCMKEKHTAASCNLRSCTKCSGKHNTLVHLDNSSRGPTSHASSNMERTHLMRSQSGPDSASAANQVPVSQSTTLAAQTDRNARKFVLLSTLLVRLRNEEGVEVECRAVLDSGSQLNVITDRMAKTLSVKPTRDHLNIRGIGRGIQQTQQRVNIELLSSTSGFSKRIEAFILPQITSIQPAHQLDITGWPIPKNIKLADPQFDRPDRIDLLIGAESYFELLAVGQIKLGKNLPTIQNTVFGWVIGGGIQTSQRSEAVCGVCSQEDGTLEEQMERFWKLEEVDSTRQPKTVSELRCESHFNLNTQRDNTGHFMVKLPFSQDPHNLGESKDIALRRFHSLERKLNKNPEMKRQYMDFIREYIALGHMEEVNLKDLPTPHYFLPHHCVMKPDSTTTKLRVVFDASMKTSSNVSLNDILHTGPTVQDELFSILLRFRLPRYVFTADIEKMYRQVQVSKDDRKFQLIFWRDDPSQPTKCYHLRTVTYGVTTAPFLATNCLQSLARQNETQHPLGSLILKQDFYVDDVMTGSNHLQEAVQMQEQLNGILLSAGFKLRKWCTNQPTIIKNIPLEDVAPQLDLTDDNDCHIKTLGLTWLPRTDEFSVRTQWTEGGRVTKRKVLSDIAHLFDPLGLMSPVVVSAKIFLQKLWILKLDWDAAVPIELHSRWIHFRQALKFVNDIKVPRHVSAGKIPQKMQLHAFSDASEKAYGAAIYVRSILQDGTILVRLLCAKSRVAPTKTTTVPRLELCAAKLTADLAHRVKTDLKENYACYFWTDSEIVLAWLNSPSASYHTFVANRVAAIQEKTAINQWRHVPSQQNPADLVSRGIDPEKLKDCSLWFYGPLFLYGKESAWPSKIVTRKTDLEKRQAKVVLSASIKTRYITDAIDHRNSFKHLQRIVAYILRFVSNARQGPDAREKAQLSVEELEGALVVIIKEAQSQGFGEDVKQLTQLHHVKSNSSLSSLSPFEDERGLIRVGGRLQESELTYDAKHPMLLPYAHNTTRLLMTNIHITNSHVGAQALLAITRQRFWPIKGKTIARSIVQNCVRCRKFKPQLLEQFMGNLPAHRVQPARPFINVGIDFCGPFWVHFKLRGKRPSKAYVALFCCFATKAVHIEVVSELTTDAFIGALKRFISRRGNCKNIYCDNATNFVGASNQLRELERVIYSKESQEKITRFSTSKSADFHFIPPRAPHFGGLWEAAVKSAKHLFQKSVSAASLTYEELETVMTEIEAILNSRPLTPMSSDPNDISALTPGHFLIGEPLTSIVDPHAGPAKGSLLQRWKLVSHLKNNFWQRWSREYLSELQHRYKWKQRCNNVQPGTMVVVKDENLPALNWPLGRIVQAIKGDDGLIRVADVKTASGVFRRPIHKLAPLPIEQEEACYSSQIDNLPAAKKKHPREQANKIGHSESSSSSEEKRPTEPHEEIPSKKSRPSTSAASLFFLTCLVMPILGSCQLEVTPFKNQPGIYFEGMGSTHLISNEWNLVIYYEMKSYWQEFATIKNGTAILNHVCKAMIEHQVCSQTCSQFHGILKEMEKNNELLLYHIPTRAKRAPLDIVGNLASSLFGVLDSRYAEKMRQIISNVEGNQQHLLELLKNQTSIIDSTANIIKRSNERTENQLRDFEGHINQTMEQMNGMQQELRDQRAAETFNALSIRLTLMTSNYQRMQSMLLDVIIDTHNGKINPLLLSPQQLKAQCTLIKENLPSTLRLPAGQNDLIELYNLMTVQGRIGPAQIIFRLKLPLFTYEPFELIRIIPVPVLTNDTFLVIEPSSRFLIISLHRDQFYPLSDNEMSACSTIGHATHMCKQHHPLYRVDSGMSACEIGYLTNSPSPTTCKITRTDKVPRWIQLINPNHWIYVMKGETTVNLICGHSVSQRSLSGSGMLNISNGCAIKDEATTIQAHSLYPTSMRSAFMPSQNLTEMLPPLEVTKLLHKPMSSYNISHDLLELKQRLQDLQVEEGSPMTPLHQTIHHFSVGYTSLLLAMGILAFFTIRRFIKCREDRRTTPPVVAPRRTPPNFSLSRETEELVELNVQRGGGC